MFAKIETYKIETRKDYVILLIAIRGGCFMRFDEIAYVKSALSSTGGYLELKENGDICFTKYKNQMEGRYQLVVWLIIKIALLFKKDKLLFTIPKNAVKDATFTLGSKGALAGIGSKWSELIIIADKEYKFYVDHTESADIYLDFINRIK